MILSSGEDRMARFSVGGDEDGNEDRPTPRPPPKRPPPPKRACTAKTPPKRVKAAASTSRDRPTSSAAAAQTQIQRIPQQVGGQVPTAEETTDESDTSWSDSSSSSEEEEEEETLPPLPTQRRSAEVQVAEARAVQVAGGSDPGRVPDGVSVTLTDPDVLDCPICYEPLCSPVYQCENGHIACASCCTIMKNKCASCCWPIGYNRCRAVEKILESVKVACQNKSRGCKETFSYNKKLSHEKSCTFASCSCPYIGCEFSSVSRIVYAHFGMTHAASSRAFRFNVVVSLLLDKTEKHIFLQETNFNTLFILNRSVETVGSFVNVVCVAPPSEKRAYVYDLVATVGESSIRLKSDVDATQKWMAQPPTKVYLIVPSSFSSISGQLKLELKISRTPVHRS